MPDYTVRSLTDLPYAKGLLLDLYLPERHAGKAPVIVWIHGGGWYTGSRKNPIGLFLVEMGYALASVDYRLSSEAIFPAQIEDCKAAVRWLRAHADEYGLDSDRFAAWGISAGAHLAALLGTAGSKPEWDTAHGYPEFSSRVQAVVDFFGPTDFLQMDEKATVKSRVVHQAPDSPESLLIGGPILDFPECVRASSPLTYISEDCPPFLIVHGALDDIVPIHQSQLLHTALSRAGVPSTLEILPDGGHGFKPEHRKRVMSLVEEFLSRHFAARGGDNRVR